MKLAPIAVFGLICNITMRVGFGAIAGMAAYVGTVAAGLFLLLIFYLLIVWSLGNMSPLKFLKKIGDVQLLAFSTSSSAAAMPLSMATAEKRLAVAPPVARFIVPLGATINMDGTALYQVSATVFLTQVYGVELGFWGLLAVIITTVGASIGTPSTPGVGIVILATILQGVGVPPSGIALIIGVDRILDMSRTTVNVTGDLVASVVMNRLLKNIDKP
jgi:Na+/H+-dicarboxylate symporter